jgi:GNAT superfamily N-acetyltransferase
MQGDVKGWVAACAYVLYADEVWIGGIVLGSTFPNIDVRDEFLGLKAFVWGFRKKRLRNPWCRENTAYWSALQHVVNHARTFIFPRFQGQGLGVAAHRELLRTGLIHWERRYQQKIAALDTLCTHNDSQLFLRNSWRLIGNARGYTSNPSEVFSNRAFVRDWKTIRNNIALKRIRAKSARWWVWGVVTDQPLLDSIVQGRYQTEETGLARGSRRALPLL